MISLGLFHLMSGTVAVGAGFFALAAPKGRYWHRMAGRVFVPSMLLMAVTGTALACLKPMPIAIIAGLLTLYLLLTAWLTVRVQVRQRLWLGMLMAVGMVLANAALLLGVRSQIGEGVPFYFFAGLAGVAAALDLRLLLSGTLGGRHRLARHLWRMCVALFIAAGSLFTGPGARIFPATWRDSDWMALPENLVLLSMLAWLAGLGLASLRQRRRRSPTSG
jgi:Predicted membrane protein (DUF2306)